MKQIAQILATIFLSTIAFNWQLSTARAQETAFTYQGRLQSGANFAGGLYDFRFSLFATNTAGTAVAGPVTNSLTLVTNGLFTALINFGGVFNGTSNWLEIGVRSNATGGFTTLSPRQQLTPTPYAIYAESAAGVAGAITIQQNTNGAPNIIAGAPNNYVSAGVYGATIAGGGATNNFGSQESNSVTANFGTVGGGLLNTVTNLAATVGGGIANIAGGFYSTVSGGINDVASGDFATVSGGAGNHAINTYSTVGGGLNNIANNSSTTVSGGEGNVASGYIAAVGGGNGNQALGGYATVGGGITNQAIGYQATVGGGGNNQANSLGATASGGIYNFANGFYSTVGGGFTNQILASFAMVGGGEFNFAHGNFSVISGGTNNVTFGDGDSIGGGANNYANGLYATVSGGQGNTASGSYATVAAGVNNAAKGAFSFAAGANAQATNNGCFVWGDPIGQFFYSTADNQFSVRAIGGARFVTASSGGIPTAGVSLAPGGGSWSSLSDRNAKENFRVVDAQTVLSAVAAMPLTTWNYKTQAASIRHIGPMAQDFYAAFAVGEDEKHITEIDESGVALVAIQGLNEKLERENAELKARLEKLERLLENRKETSAEIR